MNRRELLASTSMAAGAGVALSSLLAPVQTVAAEAKPIRIKAVETFNIALPASPTEVEAGVIGRIAVTRVLRLMVVGNLGRYSRRNENFCSHSNIAP